MQQLHPRAVWLFFITYLARWIFFILILILFVWMPVRLAKETSVFEFAGISPFFHPFIIIPILLIGDYIWARLSYYFYRYELTDKAFKKEMGVIWKKYVSIPYERIQNVDIYRGVWARILGLSDIQIQTAGMSGVALVEGRLPGLSREDAEKLREELIQRASQSKNQGL